MRNHRKNAEPTPDRQGPLARLMRAAEPLDELSMAERERIRLRLRNELARNRPVARMRLLTAMAGLALLLAGGMAVAGRLGLIRWPGPVLTPVADQREPRPRPGTRVHSKAAAPAVREGNALTVNENAPPTLPAAEPAAAPTQVAPVSPAAGQPKPSLAMVAARSRRAPSSPEPTKLRDSLGEAPSRAPRSLPPPAPVVPSPPLEPAPSLVPAAPRPAAPPSLAMVTPDSHARIPKAMPAGTTSTAPNPQDLLGQAMRSLRRQHDPATALDILVRHATLFPQSPLAGERTQLEVEALLALGRYPDALLRLDGMELGKIPRSAERLVVRGELRARASRWNEAATDFDQALAHFHGSSAWHERALWGRATARAQAGDRGGSGADMRLYLQTYPQGRFAAEAARLAEHP